MLTLERGTLVFLRNETDSESFLRTAVEGYARPGFATVNIPLPRDRGPQHAGILRNFAAAVQERESLIAPAADGLHTVELINATILAGLTGRTIPLPLSGAAYQRFFRRLIRQSQPRAQTPAVDRSSWSKTHHFGQ